MIYFTDESCDLDINDALALIEFASTDKTRTSLGVGISNGNLCATDGHSLLRFNVACAPDTDGLGRAASMHGQVWSRDYVVQQVKVAKATKRAVRLMYSAFTGGKFPPVDQVVPKPGFGKSRKPTGFDASLVARLVSVCKALTPAGKGRKAPGVLLAGNTGELDPLLFKVASEGRSADVVVMPMRI